MRKVSYVYVKQGFLPHYSQTAGKYWPRKCRKEDTKLFFR